jgi:hypothetical protein
MPPFTASPDNLDLDSHRRNSRITRHLGKTPSLASPTVLLRIRHFPEDLRDSRFVRRFSVSPAAEAGRKRLVFAIAVPTAIVTLGGRASIRRGYLQRARRCCPFSAAGFVVGVADNAVVVAFDVSSSCLGCRRYRNAAVPRRCRGARSVVVRPNAVQGQCSSVESDPGAADPSIDRSCLVGRHRVMGSVVSLSSQRRRWRAGKRTAKANGGHLATAGGSQYVPLTEKKGRAGVGTFVLSVQYVPSGGHSPHRNQVREGQVGWGSRLAYG